ncbi:hypothetical protein K450DRAFT_203127 [Umbelopsis ramanniana AG]|uniref:Uncharacterized protein n=1 Tax=Umbelopsis ramanniana AG TaxID=1314678 RepID=A0AAD5E1M9_UMBRA|nr:uncharacterized protein K450DRAFT_203127 [Umbelopsis ramanniana AG]KAI8575112.1 hypothetical protein K450DRAFT_203127 [Umbelopsis ramanniana AG]
MFTRNLASYLEYQKLSQRMQDKSTLLGCAKVERKIQFHANRAMILLDDYSDQQDVIDAITDFIDNLFHVLFVTDVGLSGQGSPISISKTATRYSTCDLFVSKANDSINSVLHQIANCFTIGKSRFTDCFGQYVSILNDIMDSYDGDADIWLAVADTTYSIAAARYVGWRSSFVQHYLTCAARGGIRPDTLYTSHDEEFYDEEQMTSILNVLSLIYLVDEESSVKARSAWLLASIMVRGALAQDSIIGETLVKKYSLLLEMLSADLLYERSQRFNYSSQELDIQQVIRDLLAAKGNNQINECFVFKYNAKCSSEDTCKDIEYHYGNSSRSIAVAQAALVAVAVLSGTIESTIDSNHLKLFDYAMCTSRLTSIVGTSLYLKNTTAHQSCIFADIHDKHNRVTVIYSETISYFVSCANIQDMSSGRLPLDIIIDNGIYEQTTAISVVMLVIGSTILLGSIILISLSQAKLIELTFDPTSFAAWLSVLYAALVVLIQNTWIEDWTWYDMLRNRRLIKTVSSTTKANLGVNTFLKYLQIRISSCDETIREVLSPEHTSASTYYANGRTAISSGPTANMILLAGRPVCYCFKDQTTYIPFRPSTLARSRHQITTTWTLLHDHETSFDASERQICIVSKKLKPGYGVAIVNGTLPQFLSS